MPRVDPALWRDMMDFLRRRHAPVCRQWFDELEPIDLDGGVLRIRTSNGVQQNYLQKKCVDQFQEAVQSATGNLVAVRFVTGEVEAAEPVAVRSAAAAQGSARPAVREALTINRPATDHFTDSSDDPFDDRIVLSPDYSFENFVPGPGNELAHAAAKAVASQPGTAYNPLFIHGGVGLGKTHLLQAICQTVLKDDPTKEIYYVSCDAFMNQFLECVQRGQMKEFRYRYRHVDVLVIDDIHFLANRERTQEEFFHTFNALFQSNRQIVLSSDSPPSEIPQLEERLVSRFGWGLVAKVTKPDYETRVAIVRSKAYLRGLELPGEVVSYIATRIESNARELEGAITTIQGHMMLQHKPLTVETARAALGDSHGGAAATQITMQDIADVVTRFYNVKLSDLQSKRRHKSITEPRQVCMWLVRQRTRFSLEEIGGFFGGRDHTTVMHSVRTVEERLDAEPDFAGQIEQIRGQVEQMAGE